VVRLREPRGLDELALSGVDTRAAVAWLDALIDADEPGCNASELSASDRDALLAALHRARWGDRVVSSLACAACREPYDLSFDLSALQQRLDDAGRAMGGTAGTQGPRTLRDIDGTCLRLPTGAQEEAAAQLGAEAGRVRLATSIAGDDAPIDPGRLSVRLEALAPLIDVDLEACCAECGHAQVVRFDLQSFVLQRILDERDGVIADMHALAAGYGWSLAEIVSLPRSLRRAFAQRLGAAAGR
jgi:hypothetical protein